MSIIDSSENQKIILATVHVNLFCISLISLNCLVTYWIMFAKSIKHVNIDDWYCINTHQPKSTTRKKKSNLLDGKNKNLLCLVWRQTLLPMDEETERGLEADPFADGWRERATEREKSRPFCWWMKRASDWEREKERRLRKERFIMVFSGFGFFFFGFGFIVLCFIIIIIFLMLCWCGKLWELQKFRFYIYIYIYRWA